MKTPEDEAFEELERRTRPVKKPQNEIIEMAQECKLIGMRPHLDGIYTEALIAFAKLVAEKEREACAKLAQETICDTHIPTGVNIYGTRAAKAIRARGEA
jgi:hypothetical protein